MANIPEERLSSSPTFVSSTSGLGPNRSCAAADGPWFDEGEAREGSSGAGADAAAGGEKDKEKGVEGKKDAVVGGDADWVKVRVGGRKVSEKFLEEKENEVRVGLVSRDSYGLNAFFIGLETQVL